MTIDLRRVRLKILESINAIKVIQSIEEKTLHVFLIMQTNFKPVKCCIQ